MITSDQSEADRGWFLLRSLIITPASQTGASLIRNCQTNDDLDDDDDDDASVFLFNWSIVKNQTKRDKVGIFRLRGGVGSPVPTSTNHNTTQK